MQHKRLNLKFLMLFVVFLFGIISYKYEYNKAVGRLLVSYTRKAKFYENHMFMLNNNVIQYSSYVINDKSGSVVKIQSIIHVNYKDIDRGSTKFQCVVRSIFDDGASDVLIETSRVIDLAEPESKQVTCMLDLENTRFKIEQISVAVVRIGDFGDAFPMFMMNFQIPRVVDVVEPRLPGVGLCVQFMYKKPEMFDDWLKIQQDIGMAEIVVHDSTDERQLKAQLNPKFAEVRPMNVGLNDTCRTDFLNFSDNKSAIELFLKVCQKFFKNEFREKYALRGKFDHMSSNDCFLTMSQKYEYVALYDIDEVIYPRSFATRAAHEYKCDSNVCEQKPFSIKMYEYVTRIVQTELKVDKSKLSSIHFAHAIYLPSDDDAKKLIDSIKELASDVASNQSFPLKLVLGKDPKRGYTFIVEANDTNYVKELSTAFDTFSCLESKYIKNGVHIKVDLKRIIYYITRMEERFPKSIHYSKNVRALFTHWELESEPGTQAFNANVSRGHILAHYRNKFYYRNEGFNGNIRKLCIDHEYAMYLLNNFSGYCKF